MARYDPFDEFDYQFTLFIMTKEPIPNTLRIERKRAGLTQRDVARKLGFASTDRICRWEKGQTFPHVLNLFKLCGLYHVLPHQLYGELFNRITPNDTTEPTLNSSEKHVGYNHYQ
jgi:transcriptional regulator with XRE-family HTH domain